MAGVLDASSDGGVLVVDDDPDISQTLLDFLEHEGYRVETASLGAVALERCRTRQYAAVVLDIGLPDIDGLVVLKELHQHDPNLPVIILTAFSPSSKTPTAMELGAFALLTKPYNREQLKATLHRAIGLKVLATRVQSIEQALAASERRFRSVVQAASDAVVLADGMGRILFWSNAAARVFQYTEEEILGQPLTLIMPARYHDAHRAGMARLLQGGYSRIVGKTVDLMGLRKDGTEVPIELSIGAWKVESDLFYCGIIRETTDRKREERAQADHLRAATLTASVSTAVSKCLTMTEMLQQCVDCMVEALDAAFAGVWLLEPDQHLVLHAGAGPAAGVDEACLRIGLGQSTVGRAAITRQPVLLDYIPSEFDGSPGWIPGDGVVQFACYPLVVDIRLLGVLAVLARRSLSDQTRGALRAVADTLALGVEHKHMHASLERLTHRYELILNSAGEGIYGLDAEGRTMFVNEAALDLLQWTSEELIGQSMHEMIHHSKADGSPHPIDDCPIYAAFREGRPCAMEEDVFWRKDGSSLPVEYISTPILEAGVIAGAVVVFKDITERLRTQHALRTSEGRFQQVMAHLRDAVWMSDPEKNTMLYVSPGYEQIWGRSCESLYASPRSWLEAIHPEDRERIFEAATQKQIHGRYVEEYRIIRPDGSIRWIRDRAFPIRDAAGVVYRIAGIAEDITEQRRARERPLSS